MTIVTMMTMIMMMMVMRNEVLFEEEAAAGQVKGRSIRGDKERGYRRS